MNLNHNNEDGAGDYRPQGKEKGWGGWEMCAAWGGKRGEQCQYLILLFNAAFFCFSL